MRQDGRALAFRLRTSEEKQQLGDQGTRSVSWDESCSAEPHDPMTADKLGSGQGQTRSVSD